MKSNRRFRIFVVMTASLLMGSTGAFAATAKLDTFCATRAPLACDPATADKPVENPIQPIVNRHQFDFGYMAGFERTVSVSFPKLSPVEDVWYGRGYQQAYLSAWNGGAVKRTDGMKKLAYRDYQSVLGGLPNPLYHDGYSAPTDPSLAAAFTAGLAHGNKDGTAAWTRAVDVIEGRVDTASYTNDTPFDLEVKNFVAVVNRTPPLKSFLGDAPLPDANKGPYDANGRPVFDEAGKRLVYNDKDQVIARKKVTRKEIEDGTYAYIGKDGKESAYYGGVRTVDVDPTIGVTVDDGLEDLPKSSALGGRDNLDRQDELEIDRTAVKVSASGYDSDTSWR